MAPRYALPNSESESEPEQSDTQSQSEPSDKELEQALRDVVARIYKAGNMEELTVKRIRLAAEKSMQLEEGFFKSNGDWKTRSDQIIKDEVEVQDTAAQELTNDKGEDNRASTPLSDTVKPVKRAKPNSRPTPRKRRKPSTESDAESELDEDIDDITRRTKRKPKAPAKTKAQPKSLKEKSEKEIVDDFDAEEEAAKSPEHKTGRADDSESEMSVVLDEEPEPKRQRQKKNAGATSKKPRKAPTKGKDADADPDQAEIKRLQGWLIKCGIRKMWFRELAPYDTSKAKIKHLKNMLKDAGMDGRYSAEKARQIREERELRDDLEMVQEGAKRWGKNNAEDASDSGQPRRRLNRGLQSLAFLGSGGEETD
ncbi:hypothetical protein BJX99DRAFT_2602 [Aspergillus californicus]